MNKRTNRQTSANTRQVPHQRLWWTELTRGLIACAFGLLFLSARPFAPRLFMYSLGTYLVVDGALDLIDTRRRNRHSLAMREIDLTIPAGVKGPPPRRTPGFRPWEELSLIWEMMIGHLLALWGSGIKLVTQHRRGRAPSPPPDTSTQQPHPEGPNSELAAHRAAQDLPSP